MKARLALSAIIAVSIFLNIYGNNWGLPSRWYVDEKVASVLHMMSDRSFVDVYDFYYHPTGYQIVLGAWLVPFFAYLKLSGYPLEALREASSVSWMHMAKLFPDFATSVYIYARVLSALFGVLTVYIVFILGRRIYNEKAGLFSAALLSVTMGFTGVNHFAKHISLLNLLIALVIFFCVSGKLLLAAFLAGAAFSVNLNALPLLLPLLMGMAFNYKSPRQFIRAALFSLILFAAGFVVGTPSVLTRFSEYALTFRGLFLSNAASAAAEKMPFYIGPLNYFFELLSIYGAPIFILVLIGAATTALNFKNVTKQEWFVVAFAFSYIFIMTVLFEDKKPQTKHIIAVVPLLALFTGKAAEAVFRIKRLASFAKYAFFLAVFAYSFVFSLKGDFVFAKDDTRYASTEWILAHIPKGAKIETFNQINYICSDRILDDYEIIYLGRSSKVFKGRYFFKWDKVEDRQEYLKSINQRDSSSDFIIVSLVDLQKIYSGSPHYLPGLDMYLRDLFEGRKNFKLVKTFTSGNRRLASKRLKGFYRPESLLWRPVPSADAVSPTIYVFERVKKL